MSTPTTRASISAVIITKNEEAILNECLTALDWVDEIIILDSGSTDKTQEIAQQHGAIFHLNPDWPGFGKQKQLAQSYATKDWILAIDADEVVTDELKHSILKMLKHPPEKTLFILRRTTWVFGRYLKYSGWYDKIVRLYPRALATYDDALVHEKVIYASDCQLAPIKGDLLHYSYRDLNQYLIKSAHYAKAWADTRQAQGKQASLLQGIGHALGCFLKMYLLKRGFLDGKQGFLIALLSAHSTFVKYADLWIRHHDQRFKKPNDLV